MSLGKSVITDDQISAFGMVSAPDKLTGTASQNKALFDKLVKEVVKGSINQLIAALTAGGGANEIGAQMEGFSTITIQGALDRLKEGNDENADDIRTLEKAVNTWAGNVVGLERKVDANKAELQAAINNRYTKEEINAIVQQAAADVAAEMSGLVDSISYKDGTLTVTDKSGIQSNIVIEAGGDADKVKFNNDLITTFEIGNIKLENGQAVIPAAGKTLTEVWNRIFVEEKNPTVTAPKVTLTAPECKAYEVGQKVSPTYTAALSAGQYEFGPATGITATSWEVTNTKTTANASDTVVGKLSTAAGTFGEVTVEDDTTYVITAAATHGAGAVPVTNLGNAYAAGAIPAGTKKATSTAISGYRNGFYGTANNKTDAVDSAFVRALPKKSGKAPAAGNVWELPVPVGAMRIAFAYPATLRDVSSVTDVNGMNAEIKTAFTKQTVSVKGSNGYTAINYKVYVLDRAEPVTEANTYKVTI